MPEQLSSKSSGVKIIFRPTSFMFDHSVANCQQFAQASDQSDLGRFTRVPQSFVEDPMTAFRLLATKAAMLSATHTVARPLQIGYHD